MMTQEAILYYADHPADFVEDLLHVTPDKNQRAILNSVAQNQMTSVRSGHGIGKSAASQQTAFADPRAGPFCLAQTSICEGGGDTSGTVAISCSRRRPLRPFRLWLVAY